MIMCINIDNDIYIFIYTRAHLIDRIANVFDGVFFYFFTIQDLYAPIR